jgi:hypothetical protein
MPVSDNQVDAPLKTLTHFSATAGLCAALLLGALPSAALANDMTLAPSPALSCLTLPARVPDRPEYPAVPLERKEGGLVKVQLEFRAPDKEPRVKLIKGSGLSSRLDDAVTNFVEQYRVPCMQAKDGPVILLQEYNFDPDGRSRVAASTPRDSADPDRAAQLKCIQHLVPDSIPDYPKASLRNEEVGTLLAKMRFTAPDQPPALEWMAPPAHNRLRVSAERYIAGLRMPCLRNGPVETIRAYQFVIAGGARTVLRDAPLIELLAGAKDLKTPAFFDFNSMSCPFELRLSYYRPFAENKVQQLDTNVAARRPLLDWLAGLTLDLKNVPSEKVFGNSLIVTVPCGKLDL